MVRGEIYFVDLTPRSGAEPNERRPCIVVLYDAFSANPRWRSVTVVPLTTSARWQRPSSTAVQLTAGEGNLPRACTALAHQVTTVDKARLIEPQIGRLPETRLAAMTAALATCLLVR